MEVLGLNIRSILQISAAVVEIIGIVMISTMYLNISAWDLPGRLLSALVRGEKAKHLADMFAATKPTAGKVLTHIQGVAFVILGFILVIISILLPAGS
ncbi:hypothetical protein DXX93_10370 [Thalassotalea euphylliae]|uniref:Uncharacterized protein n=1 Tax=Thalassotalea euphylliae TaxID=1655234 RepID=A0A3E0TR49_9GAMM|nr:hypothetical protein [Thalassotalea euphylliae]REL26933.1 hypothetical protein DXX93_10370 [Thalassotalea euphylliae]